MGKVQVAGQGERWIVYYADVLDYLDSMTWLVQYYGEFAHFLFSDWPYNLKAQVRRFGKPGSAPVKYGRDGAFQRQSRGFMGETWDGTTLAYEAETWEAILPYLHPAAFTASFTHSTKDDLLAAAQRQAGYLIAPTFYNLTLPKRLGWCYSSGKPNGTRIDTQLDEQSGAERQVVGQVKRWGHNAGNGSGSFYANGYQSTTGQVRTDAVTAPATELAQAWASHLYGSPLAPELEPIIIAQKPWKGHRLNGMVATGAGAFNIKAGREALPANGHPGHFFITHHPACVFCGEKLIKNKSGSVTGQEPSSQAYGKTLHTYEGRWNPGPYQAKGDENGHIAIPDYDCHPDCPVRRLDEQTGAEKSYHFAQADWSYEVYERLNQVVPAFYHGKVGPGERNLGCEELPLKVRKRVNPGGLEREARFAPTLQHNDHPTLKPIMLCKQIAALFLPPAYYAPHRRALVPCCGTGSEMAGCLLAGFDYVIGIEITERYAAAAVKRMAKVEEGMRWGQTNTRQMVRAKKEEKAKEPVQASLFAGTETV